MQSISTTTIVYRIQEEPEIVNERHLVRADIPPEALIPQNHQTTLSPSSSQVINILSDASYPLGYSVKRKFHGRHSSLHRIKSDILSILDEAEQKRLEAIFWNSKKGWPRTSYLEDELRAFLRSKALEKKNRHKASIITSTTESTQSLTGKKKRLSSVAKEPLQPTKRRESKMRTLRHTPSKEGQLKEILLRRKYTDAELEALYEKQGIHPALIERSPTSSEESLSTSPSEYGRKAMLSRIDSESTTKGDGSRSEQPKKRSSITRMDRKTDRSKLTWGKDKKLKVRRGSGASLHEKDLLRKESKASFKRGVIYDDEDRVTKTIRDQLSKIKPMTEDDWDEELLYLKALEEEKKRRKKMFLSNSGSGKKGSIEDVRKETELKTTRPSADEKKIKEKKTKASRDPFASIKSLGDEDIEKEYKYWKSIYETKKMNEMRDRSPSKEYVGKRRSILDSEVDDETRLMKAIEEERRRRQRKDRHSDQDTVQPRKDSDRRKRKKPHSSIGPDDLDEWAQKKTQTVARKRSINTTLGMKRRGTLENRRSSVQSQQTIKSSSLTSDLQTTLTDETELSEKDLRRKNWKLMWRWAGNQILKLIHDHAEQAVGSPKGRRTSDKIPVSVRKTIGRLYKKTKRKKAKETWFTMRWDDIAKDGSSAIATGPSDSLTVTGRRSDAHAPAPAQLKLLQATYKAAVTAEKEHSILPSSIEMKVVRRSGSKEKPDRPTSKSSSVEIKMSGVRVDKLDKASPDGTEVRFEKSLKQIVSLESIDTGSGKPDVKKTSKKEPKKAEKEKQKRRGGARGSSVHSQEIPESALKAQKKHLIKKGAEADSFKAKKTNVEDRAVMSKQLSSSDEDLHLSDEDDDFFFGLSLEHKELDRKLPDEDESLIDLSAFDLFMKDDVEEDVVETERPETVATDEIKKKKLTHRKQSAIKFKKTERRISPVISKDQAPEKEGVIAEGVTTSSPDYQKQKPRKKKQHLVEKPADFDLPRLSRSEADVLYEGDRSEHKGHLKRKIKSELDAHKSKEPIDLERTLSRRLTVSPVDISEILHPKDYNEDGKKVRKSREERLEEQTTKVIKEVITRLEQHVIKTHGKLRYEQSEADMARKGAEYAKPGAHMHDESSTALKPTAASESRILPVDDEGRVSLAREPSKLTQKASVKSLKKYSKSKESMFMPEKDRAKSSHLRSARAKGIDVDEPPVGVEDEYERAKLGRSERLEDESLPAMEYSEDENKALQQVDERVQKEDRKKRITVKDVGEEGEASGKSSASMLESEDIRPSRILSSESLESGSVRRRRASSVGSLESGKGVLRKISSEVSSEEYHRHRRKKSFEIDDVLIRHKKSSDTIDREEDRQTPRLSTTSVDKGGAKVKRKESLESVDKEVYRREPRLSRTIDRDGTHRLLKGSKESIDNKEQRRKRRPSKSSEDEDSEYESLKRGESKTSDDRDSVKLRGKEPTDLTDKEDVKARRKQSKKAIDKDVTLKRRESKESGKFRRKISQKSIDSDDVGGSIDSDAVGPRRRLSRASSFEIEKKGMKRLMSKTGVEREMRSKRKESLEKDFASDEKMSRKVSTRKLDTEDVEHRVRKIREGESTKEETLRRRLPQDETVDEGFVVKVIHTGESSLSVESGESVGKDAVEKEKFRRSLTEEEIDETQKRSRQYRSIDSSLDSIDKDGVGSILSQARSDEEDVWPTITVTESKGERARQKTASRQSSEERKPRRKASRLSMGAEADGEEDGLPHKKSKRRMDSDDFGWSAEVDSEDDRLVEKHGRTSSAKKARNSYAKAMDRRKQSIFRSVSSMSPDIQNEILHLSDRFGLGHLKDDKYKIAGKSSSKVHKYRGMNLEDDTQFGIEPLRQRDLERSEALIDTSRQAPRDEGPSTRDFAHRRKDDERAKEYRSKSLEARDFDRREHRKTSSPSADLEDVGPKHKPRGKEKSLRAKPLKGDVSPDVSIEPSSKTTGPPQGQKKESKRTPKRDTTEKTLRARKQQDYTDDELQSLETQQSSASVRSDDESKSLLSVASRASSKAGTLTPHTKSSSKEQHKPGDMGFKEQRDMGIKDTSFQHFPSVSSEKDSGAEANSTPVAFEKHPSYFKKDKRSTSPAEGRSLSSIDIVEEQPSGIFRERSDEWSSTETVLSHTDHQRGGTLPKISKKRKTPLDFMTQLSRFKTRTVLPSIEKLVPLQPRLDKTFGGWDIGAKLEMHSLSQLPSIVDSASQLVKTYVPKKLPEFTRSQMRQVQLSGFSSMEEGIKYVYFFGIEELFEYMVSNLVLEKPENPMEFLIELTRHIKKEMKIRFNVGKMLMRGSDALGEVESRKSFSLNRSSSDSSGSPTESETDFSASSGSSDDSTL